MGANNVAVLVVVVKTHVARGQQGLSNVNEGTHENHHVGLLLQDAAHEIHEWLVRQRVGRGKGPCGSANVEGLAALEKRRVGELEEFLRRRLGKVRGKAFDDALDDHLAAARVDALDEDNLTWEKRVGPDLDQVQLDAPPPGLAPRTLEHDCLAVNLARLGLAADAAAHPHSLG
jgi:hypothetical protein